MLNKVYIVITILTVLIGVYMVNKEEEKPKISRNKKVITVGYISIALGVILVIIYQLFFTTDGLYRQLP